MLQTENFAVNKTTINVITKYLNNKDFCPQHVCIVRIKNETRKHGAWRRRAISVMALFT